MAKKEDFKQDSFDLSSQTPTIICKSFVLYGSVEETHHIRVEGTIVGDIKQAHTVVIGTTGIVRGNIHAKNLVVFGRIAVSYTHLNMPAFLLLLNHFVLFSDNSF